MKRRNYLTLGIWGIYIPACWALYYATSGRVMPFTMSALCCGAAVAGLLSLAKARVL